jgi:putative transposase
MPCSPVYADSLYPCDLTDAEWALLAPLLPAPARRGRPRSWPLRLLVNALFYVLRTGCAWRYLPREYPPWQTAYTTFRQWRLHGVWQRVHEALRRAVRLRAGRHADPSAAIMDSQSVKTTEESVVSQFEFFLQGNSGVHGQTETLPKNRVASKAMTEGNRSRVGNGMC